MTTSGNGLNPWRVTGWGLAALLLALPAVAMQFTREVNWTPLDFVFAAGMIGMLGLGIELAVRMTPRWPYRLGAMLALIAAFLLVWINAAVGIIGNEDNPLNLLYLGVVAIALAGSMLARVRAAGMARAMAVTALLFAPIALIGVIGAGNEPPGAPGLVLLNAGFAVLFAGSAALFRCAAR